ncbi:putative tap domain-containing protein [Phaeomoniella chlamydospora]|uniref:Putative tap domain-containing protein n=1 Tax=Phaeomoniella chlamydospora TaxID=158046 RepID=A0A0G2GDA3_PHACM|nr:putative tap domain-containing protein [Phaeomoniella chlamydospora]
MELPLVRAPATSESPRNQSILFNPGGPGASGIGLIVQGYASFRLLFGDDFDLIGFDPRGVNHTMEWVCSSDVADPSDTLVSLNPDVIADVISLSTEQGILCQNQTLEQGTLLGTAFVARDMMEIIKALNEDGMLRYVGYSYGTLLGATFAAMFPDNVDKMILDGNVNPPGWYHGLSDASWYQEGDETLAGFFDGCVTYPENCGLENANTNTGEDLLKDYQTFVQQLRNGSLQTTNGAGDVLSGHDLETEFYQTLYSPTGWPDYSSQLQVYYDNAVTQNGSSNATISSRSYRHWKRDDTADNNVDVQWAIQCGEGGYTNNGATVNSILSLSQNYSETAPDFSADALMGNYLECVGWKMRAKEIYNGNFQVETKNPILFANGRFDPVTPLADAKYASSLFTGSRVLETTGYGHTTLEQFSTCALAYERNYMRNGTLPDLGTVCDVHWPVFSVKSPIDTFDILTRREESFENEVDMLAHVGISLQSSIPKPKRKAALH